MVLPLTAAPLAGEMIETCGGVVSGVTVKDVVLVTPFSAADRMTPPLRSDFVVNANDAEVAPAGTETEAGISTPVLVEDSATVTFAAAFASRLTEQLPEEPGTMATGRQVTPERLAATARETFVDSELDPVDAVKFATDAPAATVSEAGTFRSVVLLLRLT
jgi:hypothetical protein